MHTPSKQCRAICYISKPRDNSSPWPASTTLSSAGKLKDASVWTKQTLSSPQTDSKWPLHKKALYKNTKSLSYGFFPTQGIFVFASLHLGGAAQEEWELWILLYYQYISFKHTVCIEQCSCQMRYWGESCYVVPLKPATSVQILKRPELVLASLPAWAAVPRMQVQQQANKSFPSCQGPKWGRGKRRLTKYMFSHQSCLLFQ